jgi:replication factor A2
VVGRGSRAAWPDERAALAAIASAHGSTPGADASFPEQKSGSNSLRPVTIRQILNAQQPAAEGDFTIDGVQLGQVSLLRAQLLDERLAHSLPQLTFVGVVRNVSSFPTNVSYSVEDGTGSIDVRQWLDGNADETGKTDGIT